MFGWNKRGCRKYEVRMEDHLGVAPEAVESDLELSAHLRECARCRESFAAAQLSGTLFFAAEETEVQPSEAFVTRVMASIHEEQARLLAPAAVWRPLEVLASRFALVAAVVLLALSVFLGEFAPALRQPELGTTTEIAGDWPEPPAQPATQDDVLMSLAEAENGI
jgi:predicted anti-sigma-YlaC factor YlaD